MQKIPLKKLLKRLQKHLDAISQLGPGQAVRFRILKAKARKTVEKIKKEYPDLKQIPLEKHDE